MEKHVAVCDECGAEKALRASVTTGNLGGSGMPVSSWAFSKPDDWHQIGGKDFCSWDCVAGFAQKQAISR